MADKKELTPEVLAQYHYDNAVSGQGETWCALCRTGPKSWDHFYPWPCPVWVAAHPNDGWMVGFGYGWNLVECDGDPPRPVRTVEGDSDVGR